MAADQLVVEAERFLRNGARRPLRERMRRAGIDDADVLEAARSSRGLERLDQIKYAALEISGGISIVPRDDLR